MRSRLTYMYFLKPKDDPGYFEKCCMVPRVEKIDTELALLQIEKAFYFLADHKIPKFEVV